MVFSPLRPLKFLPWKELLQATGLALLIWKALEWAIVMPMVYFQPWENLVLSMLKPPLGLFLTWILPGLLGTIGVLMLKEFFTQVRPSNAILWSLILCLFIWIRVDALLPLSPGDWITFADSWPDLLELSLDNLSFDRLFALIVGVFVCNRGGWR